MAPFSRLCCKSTGASAVEFALVVPLFLLLVFGMIEFGVIFSDYLVLTNGVREGARVGVVTEGDISTKRVAAETAVNNYTAVFGSLYSLNVTCSDGTECSSGDSSLRVEATRMRQLITPLGELMAWFGGGIGNPIALSASSEMRNE